MSSEKEKKKLTKFKKFLLIYSGVLVVLMIVFLIYVGNSLIKYENNQIEKYIENTIEDLEKSCKKGNIKDYLGDLSNIEKSKYEKDSASIEDGLKDLFATGNVSYKLSENSKDEENPIYDVYINDKLIFQISLDGTEKAHRLGLLTFSVWKTKDITSKIENGIYKYTISVPNNYKVTINGKELTKDDVKEELIDEGLAQISKYQNIPYLVEYEIDKLIMKPEIKIVDENGKEVSYEQKDTTITKDLAFKKISDSQTALEEIKSAPEILKIAKDWSLFLSRDLTGTLHGYHNISNYLISGSDLAKYAYSWATGVDITFISRHTLDNPAFTNERLENFEIYSDKAFSCEVYLEKNMTLTRTGSKLQDVMHEKMYFALDENGVWKLVNLKSIAEGDAQNERNSDNNSSLQTP